MSQEEEPVEDVDEQQNKPDAAQQQKTLKKNEKRAKNIVQPLDFGSIKPDEIYKSECEHYNMDKKLLANVGCNVCKLIFDYTHICPHDTKADFNEDKKEILENLAEGDKSSEEKKF